MTLKQNSSLGIVFILGLLAMLMPLSIDTVSYTHLDVYKRQR